MLYLHAVENASIGINPDKELLGRLEIAQHLCWITHICGATYQAFPQPVKPHLVRGVQFKVSATKLPAKAAEDCRFHLAAHIPDRHF